MQAHSTHPKHKPRTCATTLWMRSSLPSAMNGANMPMAVSTSTVRPSSRTRLSGKGKSWLVPGLELALALALVLALGSSPALALGLLLHAYTRHPARDTAAVVSAAALMMHPVVVALALLTPCRCHELNRSHGGSMHGLTATECEDEGRPHRPADEAATGWI